MTASSKLLSVSVSTLLCHVSSARDAPASTANAAAQQHASSMSAHAAPLAIGSCGGDRGKPTGEAATRNRTGRSQTRRSTPELRSCAGASRALLSSGVDRWAPGSRLSRRREPSDSLLVHRRRATNQTPLGLAPAADACRDCQGQNRSQWTDLRS